MSKLDLAKATAIETLSASLGAGDLAPWLQSTVITHGIPRNGVNYRPYGARNCALLWIAGAGLSGPSLWFGTRFAKRATVCVKPGCEPVQIQGGAVYHHTSLDGVSVPNMRVGAEVARQRLASVIAFPRLPVRAADRAGYDPRRHVILAPPKTALRPSAATTPALLTGVTAWALAEFEIAVTEEDRWLATELGAALLGARLQIRDGVATHAPEPDALAEILRTRPDALWTAARAGGEAVRTLLNLAHPALLEHIEQGVHGEPLQLQPALLAPAEPVTALGQVLGVDVDDLSSDAASTFDEPTRLVLASEPASAVRTFFDAMSAAEGSGPAIVGAWLSGGPGTGRNQVLNALRGMLSHGGTDLRSAWLDAEDDPGSILRSVEGVWQAQQLGAVTCKLPGRFEVQHDRAIPTACLQAFHASRGLSPVLWVARLEHRLKRAAEYAQFCNTFKALARKPWPGEGNQNPYPVLEHMITALGGAVKGARRRVEHYRRTRRTASWQAMIDEVEHTLYSEPLPEDAQSGPRVCFIVELGDAQHDRDPSAIGWLRRCLSGVPERLTASGRPDRKPLWFLFCSMAPLKNLAADVRWAPKVRRGLKPHIDLARHPVTGAFQSALLVKVPKNCGPIYRMYAPARRELTRVSELDGWPVPVAKTRDDFLGSFPFLPPVLPVAQAILDALARERGDAETRPLAGLVEAAIRLRYFSAPDRFIPLDLLMEPVLKRLEEEDAKERSAARVMVSERPLTTDATFRPAFSHEDVLNTLRLLSRVPTFPCSANNLVPLLLVRLDRPVEQLVEEVSRLLEDLRQRKYVQQTQDGTWFKWLRSL